MSTEQRYHPQHPMSISYEQALDIVQRHGPIDFPDIVKMAESLPCNQPIKITDPPHTIPKTVPAPLKIATRSHISNLSRNGLIQKTGPSKNRRQTWVARVTFRDCISMLEALGDCQYVVRRKHSTYTGGINPVQKKQISDILVGKGGDSDVDMDDI